MTKSRASEASRGITHVVLFRPKADLPADEHATLIAALKTAVKDIPYIKNATIGRRVLLDRPGYETLMAEHYEYSAILDFDSEADLRAYLDHPAHNDLGRLLYSAAEAVLAYDFVAITVEDLN